MCVVHTVYYSNICERIAWITEQNTHIVKQIHLINYICSAVILCKCHSQWDVFFIGSFFLESSRSQINVECEAVKSGRVDASMYLRNFPLLHHNEMC